MTELRKSPTPTDQDRQALTALRAIFQETSPFAGEAFLQALVKGLGELLQADTTFVAHALDDPATRVRGLTAWKDKNFRESWEYDLAGNPCQLTYNGEPTFIPCDLAKNFPNKKDSGYESYLGIPLFDEDGQVIGHIAVYSSQPLEADALALELAQLCGFRAEAEVRRIIAETAMDAELSKLREADRRKTEAVQVVAHELRTPLASVIGFLSLLEADTLPSPINTYVESAAEGAERLLHFINQQLDLERILAGDPSREMQRVDLLALARAAVGQFAPLTDPFNINIQIETHLDNAVVVGDRGHLQRLLDNLISNAVKHSPDGGRIGIALTGEAGAVRISVSDQGAGIPEDLQGRLFERFSRASGETERQRGGAGLGLSIVKAIVDDHGGEIAFTSSPETGTQFIVDLPRGD